MRVSKSDTCKFISGHIAELSKLAIAENLVDLGRLLEMAQLEADTHTIAERKPKKVA